MKQSDIAAKVMQEIDTKQVTMLPRWHFLATGILSVFGMLALSGLVVYLMNVITIALRIQIIDRPMLGARQRLSDLLTNFPWWAVIIAVIAIAGLVWLLRKNSRLYRVKLGWTLILVLVIGVILGLLVSTSPLNQVHGGPGQNTPHEQQRLH
ncbi:hypothetical protein HJC99_06115 [Candidatus Saccharibacteria bacterium]|nr:hypothetical protein [Candidatus Saccharibacteria bacterium]